MQNERYSLSFSTGSLLYHESVKLAEMYIRSEKWNTVREAAVSENALQSRTMNTLKRVCREVISRLKTLHRHEIDYLTDASGQEQRYILWLAICRRYRFIADFAVNVLRENYVALVPTVNYADYDAFYNRLSEWHPELEQIRPTTQSKLRRVLFQMMREADLISEKNRIVAAVFRTELIATIARDNPQDLSFFPVFDADVKGFLV